MIDMFALPAIFGPLALFALTPPVKTPMDLDPLIQITDPSKCDFGEQFNQIGERLFIIDTTTKKIKPGVLAFPENYSDAFGKPEFQDQEDGTLVLTMPMAGTLKGFPLVAVVTSANAAGKPAKTMFVLKTDYAAAQKRLAEIVPNENSVFSIERIADVTDYITLNCEAK
jgi:hypothetical protein